MSDERITITIDKQRKETLTKAEWEEFLNRKYGKVRGVSSDEAVTALRAWVDRHDEEGRVAEGDIGETNEDVERLKDEIERLTYENGRLSAENERLHKMLEDGGQALPIPDEGRSKTKNELEEQVDLADRVDADSDETGVWSWSTYDPTQSNCEIPKGAIRRLPDEFDAVMTADEFEGEQVPAINPDHIDALPERGEARTAAVAGVLRHRDDVVSEGTMLVVAKSVTGNKTDWYVRDHFVHDKGDGPEQRVVDWLACEHPQHDGEWFTTVDTYREWLNERSQEVETRNEATVEHYLALAVADPSEWAQGRGGAPVVTESYYTEWKDKQDEIVKQGVITGFTKNVIREMLHHLYSDMGGELASLIGEYAERRALEIPFVEEADSDDEESEMEWAIIDYYEDEVRGDPLPDPVRDEIEDDFERFAPSQRAPFYEHDEAETKDDAEGEVDDGKMAEGREKLEAMAEAEMEEDANATPSSDADEGIYSLPPIADDIFAMRR